MSEIRNGLLTLLNVETIYGPFLSTASIYQQTENDMVAWHIEKKPLTFGKFVNFRAIFSYTGKIVMWVDSI